LLVHLPHKFGVGRGNNVLLVVATRGSHPSTNIGWRNVALAANDSCQVASYFNVNTTKLIGDTIADRSPAVVPAVVQHDQAV
jgi:hypothetical protein